MSGAFPLPWQNLADTPVQLGDREKWLRLQQNLDALALHTGNRSGPTAPTSLTGLYSSTWTDYSAIAGFTPSYSKSGGIVVLEGLVTKSPTTTFPGSAQTMFTLPKGFRPANTNQFAQLAVGGAGGTATSGVVVLSVNSDGTVVFNAGVTSSGLTNNMSYISLSGIVFRAAL